jgi:hypothetical protein
MDSEEQSPHKEFKGMIIRMMNKMKEDVYKKLNEFQEKI